MNYHTNYLLNVTIWLPSPSPSPGCRDAVSQADGDLSIREMRWESALDPL